MVTVVLSEKEEDFILWVRTELPFGTCTLTTHGGEPDLAEVPKAKRKFGRRVENREGGR